MIYLNVLLADKFMFKCLQVPVLCLYVAYTIQYASLICVTYQDDVKTLLLLLFCISRQLVCMFCSCRHLYYTALVHVEHALADRKKRSRT